VACALVGFGCGSESMQVGKLPVDDNGATDTASADGADAPADHAAGTPAAADAPGAGTPAAPSGGANDKQSAPKSAQPNAPDPARAAPDPTDDPAEPAFALLQGSVTNNGAGNPALGLAGKGTLGLTAKVEISKLVPGGKLDALIDVAIDASGQFSAKVPLDID